MSNKFNKVHTNKLTVDKQSCFKGDATFCEDIKVKGSVAGNLHITGDLCVDGNIYQSNGTYDVIICGVGTAGAVAFRRISDGDPNLSVLGLVTGEYLNENPISKYPFAASDPDFASINLIQSLTGTPLHTDSVTNHNWLNNTFNKNTVNAYAGRGLGGASMHNFLVAIRPSPGYHDYASGYADVEAPNWDGAACNTVYKNMETFLGPADPNRGTTGPFTILANSTPNPPYGDVTGDINASFASQSLSIADQATTTTADYNNNVELTSFTNSQQFLYPDGASPIGVSRSNSANSYLDANFITANGFSAIGRNNRIMYNAYVYRVLFDADKNAVGVEVIIDGEKKIFKANKKVIICAGTMRSPGILERSGIGSGSFLTGMGIQQVAENPNIGENFSSHSSPAYIFTVDPTAYFPNTFGSLLEVYPTTPYPYSRNVQFVNNFPFGRLYNEIGGSFGTNFKQLQQLGVPLDGSNTYICYALIGQPTSRGSVHIFDKSIDAMPKWIYNMDSNEDVFTTRTLYQHIKRVEANLTANLPAIGFSLKFPANDQYAGYPGAPTIAFTASIAGTTLTVTAVASGTLDATMSVLEGVGWNTAPASVVAQGTVIVNQIFPLLGGEAIGGIGRYVLNKSQTVGSSAMHGDYLDQAAATINIVQAHPTGTCRMGDFNTQQGVVSGDLHVHGVQNLMVADNSIWPVVPNSNTHLAAMLVGYKAADYCLATI